MVRTAPREPSLRQQWQLCERSYRLSASHHLVKSLATFNFGNLAAVKLQHEEAESRRKIALLALRINSANKVRQGHKAPARDFFEPLPERILEAHVCLVAGEDD